MRPYWISLVLMMQVHLCQAQDKVDSSLAQEAGMEQLAESNLRTVEEERVWGPGHRKKGLNQITEEWLMATGLLTIQQVQDFLLYRQTFGAFIHIHELQAIPSFDRSTIESILPWVQLDDGWPAWADWWKKSQQLISWQYTLRVGRKWQYEQDGAGDWLLSKDKHRGAPIRFWQSVQTRLQSGLDMKWQMEKDAGEKWHWQKGQRGFDFYGGFLRFPATRRLEALILGDFQVNFGQGLVQWQSFSVQKGADPLATYRQAAPIRAHQGSAESGFYRGLGTTWRWGAFRLTGFFSQRQVSATVVSQDSNRVEQISRLREDGLHRTPSEWSGRKKVVVRVIGQAAQWRFSRGTLGVHWVASQWNQGWQTQDDWYRRFDIQQKRWLNAGVDFKWNWKQWFVFGDYARDQRGGAAGLFGLWLSLAKGYSWHLLYRSYGHDYRASEAQGFGERGSPWNERGLFMGLQVRPRAGLTGKFNFDLYARPWLQYRINRPTSSYSLHTQWVWALSKKQQIEWLWKVKTSWQVGSEPIVVPALQELRQSSFRVHYRHTPDAERQYNVRVEWQVGQQGNDKIWGYQWYVDHVRSAVWRKLDVSARVYYVSQPHYNLRFYSWERAVFPGGSLQSLYGTGWRTSIQLERSWDEKLIKTSSKKLTVNVIASFSAHVLRKESTPNEAEMEQLGRSIEGRFQLIFRAID